MATGVSEAYITPDASVVSDFVESIKNKPRIVSTGEYEIMGEESSDLYTAVEPAVVGEFIDGLKSRGEASESSGETGTTTSVSALEDDRGGKLSSRTQSIVVLTVMVSRRG